MSKSEQVVITFFQFILFTQIFVLYIPGHTPDENNTLQIQNCEEDLRLQCGSESDVKDGVITSHGLD